MTLDAIRDDPNAPRETVDLLCRVVDDYDRAIGRTGPRDEDV